MSSLYLQCDRGAAGDMITAALLGLFDNPDNMVQKLNTLGVPGVEYRLGTIKKYGIQGNTMTVLVHEKDEEDVLGEAAAEKVQIHSSGHEHNPHKNGHSHSHQAEEMHAHEHKHMTMQDIEHIVRHLQLSSKVQKDILQVYSIIADAEAKAHGCPVSQIHFHEVGAADAVADVAAVCFLIDCLQPEVILSSDIHTGNGTVKCAHGILQVPAPATANILQGMPWTKGKTEGEICTPTGAALIRYFTDQFMTKPTGMKEKCGIGIGRRTFSCPSYFAASLFEKPEK